MLCDEERLWPFGFGVGLRDRIDLGRGHARLQLLEVGWVVSFERLPIVTSTKLFDKLPNRRVSYTQMDSAKR